MEILCDLLNSLMDKNDKVKIQNERLSRKRSESSETGEAKKPKLRNGNSELQPAVCFETNPDSHEGNMLLPWKQPINGLLEH